MRNNTKHIKNKEKKENIDNTSIFKFLKRKFLNIKFLFYIFLYIFISYIYMKYFYIYFIMIYIFILFKIFLLLSETLACHYVYSIILLFKTIKCKK